LLKEKLTQRLEAAKVRRRDEQQMAAPRQQEPNPDQARWNEDSQRLQAALARAETYLEGLRKYGSADPFFDDPEAVKAQAKLEQATQEHDSLRKEKKVPDDPAVKAARTRRDTAQTELDAKWAQRKLQRERMVRRAYDIQLAQQEVERIKAQQAVVDAKLRDVPMTGKAADTSALETNIAAIDREIADLETQGKNLPGTNQAPGAQQVGVIKVWDAATGVERFSFNEPKGAFRFVAFLPDGTALVAVSASGTVIMRELTVIPGTRRILR
jgi:hypothetical protein